MATHRCKTQCFHAGHLFEVGEEAQFNPGQKVPEHFEPIKGADKPDPKKAGSDPRGDADKPDADE